MFKLITLLFLVSISNILYSQTEMFIGEIYKVATIPLDSTLKENDDLRQRLATKLNRVKFTKQVYLRSVDTQKSRLFPKIDKITMDDAIEVAKKLQADIIINVQGDEPLIDSSILSSLIKTFDDEAVSIATVKSLIKDEKMVFDENAVKVVCDKNDFAMYFSRAPIPFKRSDINIDVDYYKHIGVYAYRKQTLLSIENMQVSEYENIEMLEQLRWLYNGLKIKVITTDKNLHGVDTKEDLEYVENILKSNV